jgi:translation initiation factor IF-2
LAKNLKLTIKNTQIAEAVNLGGLKSKLASKKAAAQEPPKAAAPKQTSNKALKAEAIDESSKESKEEAPRIRARSKSAFAEGSDARSFIPVHETTGQSEDSDQSLETETSKSETSEDVPLALPRRKTSEELRKEIFGDEITTQQREALGPVKNALSGHITPFQESSSRLRNDVQEQPKAAPKARKGPRVPLGPKLSMPVSSSSVYVPPQSTEERVRLGPTGKHIKDLMPAKPVRPSAEISSQSGKPEHQSIDTSEDKSKAKVKGRTKEEEEVSSDDKEKKSLKSSKFKEFRDIKPAKKVEQTRFDARDRQGLRDGDEGQQWRKKRVKHRYQQEDTTIRPSSLKVRIPISIKDLAVEMKLKASQLIAKLFAQGMIVTMNDLLEDETTIQLLGHEFDCEITIDTSEQERIRITDKTVKEEIQATDPERLIMRPPVVAFMGHVDHGKTSLIDAIRKSNRAAGEAGAITQHIGAFRCSTPVGDIAILDTPGHEAFSAMRARGADVTDIVVLVVAGDEGLRQQTIDAIQQARAANVTMVIAINKSDRPNYDPDTVYRQLAENNLLPEVWGGQTITVNCSAVTGEGIPQLLEMLALQAEVLELKADPKCRARGSVLESEMHKGMGAIATVLVQNGTLRCGDALVFGQLYGRVKTMYDEFNRELTEAGPSTPVEITGLSGLPEAGQEFIVVKNEREAREIAEARMLGMRQVNLLQSKKLSMENLFQQAAETNKKILNVLLRADVQGSLEALKVALMKIESQKAELNIIFAGVGEISESDVQLAAASKAVIIGFHNQIESHADTLLKQLGVQVKLHSIIYHAIDDVKNLLSGLLDKIAQETEKGKADVLATFKSSQHGVIAGCIVTEGSIHRSHNVRVRRGGEVVWKGAMSSLKRVKEDVREVTKGLECGVLLNNFNNVEAGDVIETYEVTYITQEL